MVNVLPYTRARLSAERLGGHVQKLVVAQPDATSSCPRPPIHSKSALTLVNVAWGHPSFLGSCSCFFFFFFFFFDWDGDGGTKGLTSELVSGGSKTGMFSYQAYRDRIYGRS